MNKPEGSSPGARLVFLKLGGSLITDKQTPRTARVEIIQRICGEIKTALAEDPELRILLGHGSGSFGHVSGSKYQTRDGVSSPSDWLGFSKVWQDASTLNRLIMEALNTSDLPGICFPPSAGILCQGRKILTWDLKPLRAALNHRLIPVVYGDVVFDTDLGGTILSTEDLFVFLAKEFKPDRILLAGLDPGVWKDYPEKTSLFTEITPADQVQTNEAVGRSAATDVTGGMAEKVNQMLELISSNPGLEAVIFSGEDPGSIQQALLGTVSGTRIHS
ncbi:MAG: isopentenyl phosphate kinase [Anaerolineales bacterium]